MCSRSVPDQFLPSPRRPAKRRTARYCISKFDRRICREDQQKRHLGSTQNCHAIWTSIVVDAPLPGAQAGCATVLFKNAVPCRQKDCFDEVAAGLDGPKDSFSERDEGHVAEARKNQVGNFRMLEIRTERFTSQNFDFVRTTDRTREGLPVFASL